MLRNIKIALCCGIAGLTALWLHANLALFDSLTLMATRDHLVQYSGVIAIGATSVAMVLAVRPVWIEPWLGGLDKSYRLHKWLGIAGLSAAILHWVVVNAPKWAVTLGFMAVPERGARPADAEITDHCHHRVFSKRFAECRRRAGRWLEKP